MLPKTVQDIVGRSELSAYAWWPDRDRFVVSVLEAAGIKIADDGQTLIYPSTQGTNTPRYQVAEQRNVRFRGRRK